jgi:signal transduction histidine kinase
VHEQGLIVRDDRGAPVQIIGALTDISERHNVAELGQRLAQASRLTAMGELTASIAHEINQPMSAILSNVDAAEMLLERGDYRDSELREILDDIRADDLRAGEIIRHIRGLARPRESQPQYFSIRELIEGVLRLIAPMAQRRGIRLSASFVPGITVYADRVHVQQVLLNLLLNAIDAMELLPENQRILRVDTCLRKEGFAEIAVDDCGHGIPVTHLDRIFDSFFTTKKEGLGLGLSIARSLVEAHGGTIWALNKDDNGATFRFTLPTRPRAA